jgi:hypothetical protein
MKNIKNILVLLALIALVATSCKKVEYQYTYDGNNYVQLISGSGTYFVLEGDTVTFSIQFQIIGDAPESEITMPVIFLDSADIDGNMAYATILPGEKGISAESSVTIPAGSFTGSLTVSGTYDSLEFSEVDTVLIQLTDGTVKADSYNDIFLLKIQKYYPYIPEEYPGHYEGTYTGYALGGFGNNGTTPTSMGLDIIIGEAPQTLVVTQGFYQEQLDDWGETWTDGPYPVTLYMNTDDPTNFVIEIVGTNYLGTTDDTWVYWIGPHPVPGQFNAATKELNIKFYEFYDGPDQLNDIGEYTVTLTEEAAAKLLGNTKSVSGK